MAATRFSFDLVANVGRFRRGFRGADRVVRRFGDRLGFLRSRLTQVGGALAAFFGGRQLVRGFQAIVGEASDLETQMARVRAVSGATDEEMQRLSQTAVRMGENTTFTAIEAAGAMENLARAGLSASEQIEAIPNVLEFAEANSLQLAEAASLVTGSVNGMNLSFSESQRVTDTLTAAAQNADATVQDLGQSLSFAAPTANALGLEIETTTALIGTLADAGFSGSRAGTALNNIFSQLSDSSSTFSRALREAGIESTNVVDVLQELERGGPEAEAAVNALGTEAGPALRVLLSEGSDSIRGFTGDLRNAEGASAEAAGTMRDTLQGSLQLLGSAWNTLKRELGDPILDRVRKGVDDLAQGIRDFVDSDNLGRLQQSLVETWDRGRAAVERFLQDFDITDAVQRVVGTIDRVTSAVGRMGAAMEVAGASVRTVWNGINAVVSTVMAAIAQGVSDLQSGLARVTEGLSAVGVVSEETAARVRTHVEALQASADAMKEHARESAGRTVEATVDLGDAVGRLTERNREAEPAVRATSAATGEMGEASQQASSDIETLDETLAGLSESADGAKKSVDGLGDSANIETLDETLSGAAEAADGVKESVGGIGDDANIETLDQTMNNLAGAALDARARIRETQDEASREARDQARDMGDAGEEAAEQAESGASRVVAASTNAVTAVSNALRSKYADVSSAAESAFEVAQERAIGMGRTVDGFFRRLGQERDRLDERIQSERDALGRMQRTIDDATESQEDLARVARMSTDQFELLGDEELKPVRTAIDDAQRRLESMRESARGTLQSVEDELLQLQGREDELADRRRDRRREEIRGQLAEARAAGDSESVSQLQRALSTLREIGEEERRQARAERAEKERSARAERDERQRRARRNREGQRQAQEASRRAAPRPSRTVRIEIGNAAADVPEDQADSFIDELEQMRKRTAS